MHAQEMTNQKCDQLNQKKCLNLKSSQKKNSAMSYAGEEIMKRTMAELLTVG